MEYTFRNDSDGTLTQVELNEFQVTVRENGKDRNIPYSAITDVLLERKKNFFSVRIRSTDFGSFKIISQHPSKEGEAQSRQYNTFVRILHYHLIKNHTSIEYWSGIRPGNIGIKSLYILVLVAFVYSLEDYFNFIPVQPTILAFLILSLGLLLILAPYLISKPKTYNPTDIPLTMLPPVT